MHHGFHALGMSWAGRAAVAQASHTPFCCMDAFVVVSKYRVVVIVAPPCDHMVTMFFPWPCPELPGCPCRLHVGWNTQVSQQPGPMLQYSIVKTQASPLNLCSMGGPSTRVGVLYRHRNRHVVVAGVCEEHTPISVVAIAQCSSSQMDLRHCVRSPLLLQNQGGDAHQSL